MRSSHPIPAKSGFHSPKKHPPNKFSSACYNHDDVTRLQRLGKHKLSSRKTDFLLPLVSLLPHLSMIRRPFLLVILHRPRSQVLNIVLIFVALVFGCFSSGHPLHQAETFSDTAHIESLRVGSWQLVVGSRQSAVGSRQSDACSFIQMV